MPSSTRGQRLLAAHLLALVGIGVAIQLGGWTRTWQALSVPSLSPVFADMRSVQAGLGARRQGLDPQVENPGDPWQRPMNYPRLWLAIGSASGFESERGFLVYCGVQLALFVLAASLLLLRFPSLLLLAALLSTSTLLAIERGNNDLLIYAILTLGSLQRSSVLGAAAVLAASVLKIYPLFALPAAAERFRTRRAAALAVAVVVGLFALTTAGELGAIRHATPASKRLSYGVGQISERLHFDGAPVIPPAVLSLLLLTGCAAGVCAGRRYGWPGLRHDGPDTLPNRLFQLSALLYTATFLLGSNFDYRLIFLTLAIPALTIDPVYPLRRTLSVCILLAMNQTLLRRVGLFGDIAVDAAKLLLLVFLLSWLIDRALDRYGGRLTRQRSA